MVQEAAQKCRELRLRPFYLYLLGLTDKLGFAGFPLSFGSQSQRLRIQQSQHRATSWYLLGIIWRHLPE